MFIQVHKPSKESRNAGSSKRVINYLEKENQNLELLDETPFFTHEENAVSAFKAQAELDGNHRGLKSNDSKFYMITINPSEHELKHLENNPEKIKEYTRSVMDEYAKNFNRQVDGRPLEGKDLIYFAKIEHERRYDPLDKKHQETYKINQDIRRQISICQRDIKYNNGNALDKFQLEGKIKEFDKQYVRDIGNNVILAGNTKVGNNMHVHIVVSRKDKSQKVALSPFANARNAKNELNGNKVQIGFDRKDFVEKCEQKFDNSFQYERAVQDKFQTKYERKHEPEKYVRTMLNMPTNERQLAQRLVKDLFDKDRQIQSMLQPLKNVPRTEGQIKSKLQNMAVDSVSKLLAGGTNPTAALIKTAVQKVIEVGMSQGLTF